jgi:galactonate dehydratase
VHTLPEFHELIAGGLVDVIQADLTHFGGFLAMNRLAGWADAYHLVIAPHNVCGPVGTAANLQLAVSTANYKVLEHFNDFADPWVRELVDQPPTVDAADRCFAAPERPGLGVRLDHDACAEHPASGAWLCLFQPGWERREAW